MNKTTLTKPEISFMAISDTHAPNDIKIKNALNDAIQNNVDVIFLTGDLVEIAYESNYESFIKAMNSVPHPKTYYALGNHDVRWLSGDFDEAKEKFLKYTGMPGVYYDKWINGYHFIVLGTEKALKDQADFSDKQLAWLEAKLAEDTDPNKPIFVFNHTPLFNTVPDSYWEGYQPGGDDGIIQDEQVKNILANYPQTVFISGHTHFSIKEKDNLFHAPFGHMINDGAVVINEGLIFNVYKGKIEIKGRNLDAHMDIANWDIFFNQSVQFLGLGDSQFAELRTNLNQQQAVFHVTNKNPHAYYANEKYAEIQVLDENKKVIFNKEIQGTNVSIGQDTIPLKEGYTIKIYHAETRTRLKSLDFNLINSKSNDNMFIMTKNGLINTLTPVQKKSIHHLVAPTWIFNAGISKGKYHDRQDLGVILQPQATIRIRQVNPHFKDKLTVRLLNDDRLTEKKEGVTSEWSTIQADAISVPFIDTPYGDQNAEVEYTIEGKQIPLPIYQPCGNKMEFFQQWDKEQAGFALVQGPSFQLLVPAKDKEALRNLKEFKSIDELIQYYEEIFQLFNDMIGLEDTDTGTNKMSQNRYFLKADAHGAGGAYYSHDYTANSYATVDMWLKKNNWGPLHEIAHGYQAAFDNKGMYTGEVSNNLFGVQHQYSKNGKDADKIGWLFDYGKKESVEKNLYQAIIKEGKGYTEVDDLRFQLILLTMLKQKAGNEAFTHLYREYRKLANQE
ncbi:putative mucin/carbohydrate-binding domain-containing protein, partial [Paenibacillus larvae]|uniref:putative mucin/carbohydrate-binding domain-containing protein n=1 Tax=Paenibacillus larvae TaxID=1464 RepID=UPI003F6B20DF